MDITALKINHLEAVRTLAHTKGGDIVEPKKIREYWFYQEFGLSFVAIDGGEVIGFILAMQNPRKREDLYVENILVRPERGDERIGAALLRRAFEEGKASGCRFSWGVVLPTNKSMFEFLSAIGIKNKSAQAKNHIDIKGKQMNIEGEEPFIENCNGQGKDYSIVGVELTNDYLEKLGRYVKGENVKF